MTNPLSDQPRERILSLVSLGRRYDVSEADLLEGTQLSAACLSDDSVLITFDQEYDVVRNLLAHTSPAVPLPLEAGFDFHLKNVRAWGEAMRTSRDLGEAMAFSLAYAQKTRSQVHVTATIHDDDAVLVVQVDHLPEDVQQFVGLRNLVFLAMTARELIGRALPLNAVQVLGPRPAYAAAVDRFCGISVSWDAEVTHAAFDASWLSHPLPGADAKAHLVAVRQCHRDLDHSRAQAGIAARVREALAVFGHEASFRQIADDLEMSERSLRRRLQEDGTSFRRLQGLARMELAAELFAQGLTVERASERLGYSEPAAFSKAFKRWSGMTPQIWRALP